jgi:Nuclease-related domain
MPSRRREHDRACRCDRADGGCAALAVQRLSRTRVQELAEEIWTVSTGTTVPVQPLLDPRGSRPGASAQAAYQRCRHKELEHCRDRWWWPWRSLVVAAAGLSAGLLVGLAMGAWLGWRVAALAGVLAWWRAGFHPSATARFWRRQAHMQRRTAGVLDELEEEGWLVLHDVALPGWSASLDHLVIGPTGAWVIESSRGTSRGTRSPRPDLSWKAAAVADSLASTGVAVQPLLVLHLGVRLPGRRPVQGIALVSLRRLPEVVRHGSRAQAVEVQQASARALQVLRPAA